MAIFSQVLEDVEENLEVIDELVEDIENVESAEEISDIIEENKEESAFDQAQKLSETRPQIYFLETPDCEECD